jgi:hypothetical protein
MEGMLGAVAVAVLVSAGPAQATGGGAARHDERAGEPWAVVWKAVERAWSGALEVIGVRAVVEADGANPVGGGVKGTGGGRAVPSSMDGSGDQGGGVDPDG